MKNLFSLLVLAAALAFTACGGADKAKEVAKDAATATTDAVVSTGDAMAKLVGDKYAVNTQASMIKWTGSKKVGDSHTGTLVLSNGTVAVDKGTITGGQFTINLSSLTNTDMAGSDGAGKLEGHLKSPDFFDVAKFPNATFSITKVTKVMNNDAMTHTVSGDLTLMGVSKNISMPATVKVENDRVIASVSNYALNRTDWGMKYGSGLLGLAADKIINDDVMISMSLVAAK